MPLFEADTQERAKSLVIETRALATQSYIPAVYQTLITGGYFLNGDNGSAQYKRAISEPTAPGKFQDASGAWWEMVGSIVNLLAMGAKGDGVTDDRASLVAAIAQANGAPIYAPRGEYLISASIAVIIFPSAGGAKFGPGVKVLGDGIDVTVFKYTGSNGFMLDIDSAGHVPPDDSYVMNCEFRDFSLRGSVALSNNGGIKLRTCYHTTINTCRFTTLKGDGVRLASAVIDYDATAYTRILNCSFDLCSSWAINARAEVSTNSTSFVIIDGCRFQSCGTPDGAYQPTSGGVVWKGLIAQITNCGFTLNRNAQIFIPGEENLANRITLDNVDIENGLERGIFCRGVIGFKATNLEFLANAGGPTSHFIEFDANDYVVRDVEIDGVTVRCGKDDDTPIPNVAFKIGGANAVLATCRVRNVYWLDYDYGATQTRFDGWEFDPVAKCGSLIAISGTELNLRSVDIADGNTFPLRLAGPAAQSSGGVASKTGELTIGRFPSSGIGVSNSGLNANALCYIYARDSGGGALSLVANNTVPVLNSALGLQVMTGEPAFIYVGRWMTNGSSQFITTGVGWLNPRRITTGSSIGYTWIAGSGAAYWSNSLPTNDTDGNLI